MRLPRSVPAALLWIAACSPAAPQGTVRVGGYAPASAERLRAQGWRTDLSRLEVPLESMCVGPPLREAFVPIDPPAHAPAREVALDPREPVLVLRSPDGVRAWPLAHLLRRELALEEVGGVPVAVSFCSLSASARAWDLRAEGEVLDLGVSGILLGGNALLFDRRTESLWRQISGEAVAGELAGTGLRALPAFTVSFGELRDAHPEAAVLLPVEGPFPPLTVLAAGEVDRRSCPWLEVEPQGLALCLSVAGAPPIAVAGARVQNIDGGAGIVVLPDPAAALPYRDESGGPGPLAGSAAAFRRTVGGRVLTFEEVEGALRDRETGTRWNRLGEAVEGELAGTALEPVPQVLGFRFALARGG